MIIAIFAMIILVIDLYAKKSKTLFAITFFFLWILMAFTYGNADYNVYVSRYTDLDVWTSQTEFLFGLLIYISNWIGLSFQAYKAVISLIILLLISFTIWKDARYPNTVMAFYILFTFPMDVAQIRNALATAIMIYFLHYLIIEDKKEQKKMWFTKNEWFFIFGILLATLVHTASLFWILLLVARRLNTKSVVVFTIFFNIAFSTILSPKLISWIASKFGASMRINAYVSIAYKSTRDYLLRGALIRTVFFGVVIILLLSYLVYNKKTGQKLYADNIETLKTALNCNIIMMSIISFMVVYTPEIYRMQIGISILNYIVITNCMKKSVRLQVPVWNLKLGSALMGFTLINMYLLIVHNNFTSVMLPIFMNNAFFDLFKF